MKLCIKNLTFLLIFSIPIFGGCLGYGQKTITDKPIISDEKQNKTNPKQRGKTAKLSPEQFTDLEYRATLKGVEYIEISREDVVGVPYPWNPIVVPLEWWEKHVEKLDELRIARRQKTITDEEYEAKILQILREYGLVAYAQLGIELNGGSVRRTDRYLVNLAYAEDPDDFNILLMWVVAGGDSYDPTYGIERTAATRRLYEMNPDHPWVLHYLAKCLLGCNPQEALGYAQKAQELDPIYLLYGVEGLCYFQMGDFDKALEAFKRSQKAAVATSNLCIACIARAISEWKGKAISRVNSDLFDSYRKAGKPILGPDLPMPLRH